LSLHHHPLCDHHRMCLRLRRMHRHPHHHHRHHRRRHPHLKCPRNKAAAVAVAAAVQAARVVEGEAVRAVGAPARIGGRLLVALAMIMMPVEVAGQRPIRANGITARLLSNDGPFMLSREQKEAPKEEAKARTPSRENEINGQVRKVVSSHAAITQPPMANLVAGDLPLAIIMAMTRHKPLLKAPLRGVEDVPVAKAPKAPQVEVGKAVLARIGRLTHLMAREAKTVAQRRKLLAQSHSQRGEAEAGVREPPCPR